MSDSVLRERHGATLVIRLNKPELRNAFDLEMRQGIAEAVYEARDTAEVRAVVITGSDKAFCAGGDLQPGKGFAFDFSKPSVDYADLLRDAQNATLPIIARVNGTCMAGGMGLLCMADMAVVADKVFVGLPEVKVGLLPMQVLSLLQNLVPRRLVREWALTGEPIGAQEALDAGLVNHVAPAGELDAKTDWLLSRLVDKSPTAIRRGKYAMRAIEAMSFDQAIAYTESQIALLAMTEDAKEGLAAFNERRKPVWTGR
jgi:enoyl-CoA hydratase/carnithine racemase